jgi:hypothetical protein
MDVYKYDARGFWRVPVCIMATKAWSNWIGTSEAKIWSKLYENTVRGEMNNSIGQMIYEKYFKKGLVCVHCRQEKIANYLGIASKSVISEALSSMAKKGILKKHKDRWNNTNIIVYELGTHDKTVSKNENLHLYTYVMREDSADLSGKPESIDKYK